MRLSGPTLAIAALISLTGFGPLCLAQPLSSAMGRSFREGQYDSFYIDVNDMPDYVKAVAIPLEKGKCNIFIQYLDISGKLFNDDVNGEVNKFGTSLPSYGVGHAFPACNQGSPPALGVDDETAKRLKVRDVDFRYGKDFVVLEDLIPAPEGTAYVSGTKLSRYRVKTDNNGVPLYPVKELEKAPTAETFKGKYNYGPGKVPSDLFGPHPDPKTIAVGQNPLSIQGFELAKIRPGLGWKDEFGLFVYPMPPPL